MLAKKTKIIGAAAGFIGGLLGIYPIMDIRFLSMETLLDIFGGYNDIPDLLALIAMGIPFPSQLWIPSVAIGGAVFGVIGAGRAQKRRGAERKKL